MLRSLLRFLWQAFSLLGAVLSLRRWWRTMTDEDASRQERLQAGALLLFMGTLLVWSVLAGVRLHHAAPAATGGAQIVVDLRDDLSLQAIDRWDARYGLELRPNSPESVDERLMIGDISRLTPAERARLLERLRRDPNVEAADENFEVHLYQYELPRQSRRPVAAREVGARFVPNDPRYKEQWNFAMIGMPAAWEKATGKGVVVAVIDTGCAFEKEGDIPVASDLRETAFVKPYDFIKNKKKAYDDHGHGTHVAGTIAQSTNNKHGVAGIAYQATIMPLKVLSAQGSGQVSDIADAIRYAADNGANVINMSLGGPRGSSVMRQAVTYAHQKGVTIVCAAGNGGGEGVGFPAAYPECIAVSSVGPSGNLAFYSSYGKEVTLAAPGGEYRSPEEQEGGVLQNTVFQKQDRFEHWQGTSMASPHVAGVAALLHGSGIKGPEAIRAQLKKTATPKDDPLKYGAGVLNAAKAVGAADEPAPEFVAGAEPPRRPRSRLGALAPRLVGAGVLHGLLVMLLLGIGRIRARGNGGLILGGVPVAAGLTLLGYSLKGHATAALLPCAAWPFAATAFLWGIKPLRPWLGGLWVGTAAAALALLPTGIHPLWLVGNAAAALVMARLVTMPDR